MTEAIVRHAVHDDLPVVLELYQHLHPDEQLPPETANTVWSALLGSSFITVVLAQSGERRYRPALSPSCRTYLGVADLMP